MSNDYAMRRPMLLIIIYLPFIDSIYQSQFTLTARGMEYQPRNGLDMIGTRVFSNHLFCSMACNLQPVCRTFDFDYQSGRCRLFEGDLSTGSIISSSSVTSVVGLLRIDAGLFASVHNQPCQACQSNRYGVCSLDTNLCRCPPRSFWNGLVCLPQLYLNQTCREVNSCRTDLNLTCSMDCYGEFRNCIPALNGSSLGAVTVLGSCNGTIVPNTTVLSVPGGISVTSNGSILVGDSVRTLLSFVPGNRRANILTTYASWPAYLYVNNASSLVYATITLLHIVRIWPTNATIPPNGVSGNCSINQFNQPTGIVGDSAGNIYVASSNCHWVTKWAPNSSNGTLVAGSSSGLSGSGTSSLAFPRALALDEARSYLYVCDQFNNRVIRFTLGGSPNGVVVAGGNGAGTAPNQLNRPFGLSISRIDSSLYIADLYNNRVQKWVINATAGSTIAGNANGIAGNRANELNQPDGIALDLDEKYLYVADSGNGRIQQFLLS